MVALVRIEVEPFRQGAAGPGGSHKGHLVALRHRAGLAPSALQAAHNGAASHAVSHRKLRDTFTNRHNAPRHLVSRDYWRTDAGQGVRSVDRNIDGTSHVLMKVRAADSAPSHRDLDLARW